jgi:hypothetical protein
MNIKLPVIITKFLKAKSGMLAPLLLLVLPMTSLTISPGKELSIINNIIKSVSK